MIPTSTSHLSLKSLESDERQIISRTEHPSIFKGSYAPSFNFISEAGLYAFLNRADRKDKPQVIAFQRWVNHDVLPSTVKAGGYQLVDGCDTVVGRNSYIIGDNLGQ